MDPITILVGHVNNHACPMAIAILLFTFLSVIVVPFVVRDILRG